MMMMTMMKFAFHAAGMPLSAYHIGSLINVIELPTTRKEDYINIYGSKYSLLLLDLYPVT